MDRRSFVSALPAVAPSLARWSAGAAALSPFGAFARSAPASVPAPGSVPASGSAAGSVANDAVGAWRRAFLSAKVDYAPVSVSFRGRLPDGLAGTLYRNGPSLMRRGSTEYRHWFDGDGLVQSYALAGGRLTHRARSVRTTRFVAEQSAGRYLWNGFGTAFADARPMSRPDDLNPANISMLASGNELLALWEAGSPYKIDPVSLETRGRKVWSEETDGLPFSAHPRVDADGTIWSFGYLSGSGKIALYRIDASGAMRASTVIDAPNADMVHDFAITERYLVFVLIPYLLEGREGPGSLLERYRWHANRPTVLMLVDKQTLSVVRRAELPAIGLFHLGNAWEDGRSLRVQIMRVGDLPGLIAAMADSVQGRPVRAFASPDDGVAEIVLDLGSGRARVAQLLPGAADFPAFDRRATGRRIPSLFAIRRSASFPAQAFGLNELIRIDLDRQRVDAFDYGSGITAEEHLFVAAPKSGGGAGWLLGTAYDWRREKTLLSVFDARSLSDGPLAQAELPYGLPPGLHGLFLPARA